MAISYRTLKTSLGALLLSVTLGCGGDSRELSLECDPSTQDCPSGQKCNPVGPPPPGPWIGTTCVDDNADNGSVVGTPCFTGDESVDTCDPQSTCIQLGFGEGACMAYCGVVADVGGCAEGEVCVAYDADIGLHLCAPSCDLSAPDCALIFECVDTRAGPACLPISGTGAP